MKLEYSPQLDGLRTFCILFTLFNHIDGSPEIILGSVGVDVFFPLSGFLITFILLTSSKHDLKGYYIKRFFRIAPVYYLAFFATCALALVVSYLGIGESKLAQLKEIFIPSMLFSRELSSAPTLFGQAWTIGIEEKFYLIFPLLLIFLPRKLFYCSIALFVLFLTYLNIDMLTRGYVGILFGSLSAILYSKFKFSLSPIIGLVMLIISYISMIYYDFKLHNLAISFSATFFIIGLYTKKDSIISRFLSYKAFVFLGKLTFSLYLFHVLAINVVEVALSKLNIHDWYIVFALSYGLSILIAYLVYVFYENPLITYGKNLATKVKIKSNIDLSIKPDQTTKDVA